MLSTWYFRFGREFRLSVCPWQRDVYVDNISALKANFEWQEECGYARNIYSTKDKLYILKLNLNISWQVVYVHHC